MSDNLDLSGGALFSSDLETQRIERDFALRILKLLFKDDPSLFVHVVNSGLFNNFVGPIENEDVPVVPRIFSDLVLANRAGIYDAKEIDEFIANKLRLAAREK